jgi:FtsP/CotA-like multicopper oxidase with cupredoxin domain
MREKTKSYLIPDPSLSPPIWFYRSYIHRSNVVPHFPLLKFKPLFVHGLTGLLFVGKSVYAVPMAPSLPLLPAIGATLLLWIHSSLAATITYDFNITWLLANPDGMYTRPVIGINNQFPIPPIVGTLGDRVIVNVNNQLGNQSTSLHFHGLFQNGTTHMDGPVQVSQCPIPPGSSYTYNFTACKK